MPGDRISAYAAGPNLLEPEHRVPTFAFGGAPLVDQQERVGVDVWSGQLTHWVSPDSASARRWARLKPRVNDTLS